MMEAVWPDARNASTADGLLAVIGLYIEESTGSMSTVALTMSGFVVKARDAILPPRLCPAVNTEEELARTFCGSTASTLPSVIQRRSGSTRVESSEEADINNGTVYPYKGSVVAAINVCGRGEEQSFTSASVLHHQSFHFYRK